MIISNILFLLYTFYLPCIPKFSDYLLYFCNVKMKRVKGLRFGYI
jgi:hypothetical protein